MGHSGIDREHAEHVSHLWPQAQREKLQRENWVHKAGQDGIKTYRGI